MLIPKQNRRKHYLRCGIRDLAQDPYRISVSTHKLRPWRLECDLCITRYNIGERHRCKAMKITKNGEDAGVRRIEVFLKKRLCLYCDQYTFRPTRHKHKCPRIQLFERIMPVIVPTWEKKLRIFHRRIGKLLKFKQKVEMRKLLPQIIKRLKKNQVELEIKDTEEKKFVHPIFKKVQINKEKCDKLISEIQNGPETKRQLPQNRFPRSFLNYRLAPEPVQRTYLTETKKELTHHEKEALRGLITWDQYIDNQKKIEERLINLKERPENYMYLLLEKDKFDNTRVIDLKVDDDDSDSIIAPRTPHHETVADRMGRFIDIAKGSDSPVYEPEPPIPYNNDETMNEESEDVDDEMNMPVEIEEKTPNFEFQISEMDRKYFDRVKRLYRVSFEFIENWQITGWMKEDTTLVCYNERHLISALTYKHLSFAGVDYLDLILLGVNQQYRGQGFGTKIMEKLMELGRVLTWADDYAVGFYEKLGFMKFWPTTNTQDLLIFFTHSTLMGYGFSVEDCSNMSLNKI
jgi:ribosomal protein S18 acetylase RimI-like enzyme